MRYTSKHIDDAIIELLKRLLGEQNPDGSFTTYYLQPEFQPENGWMQYPDNSPFCTASVVIPLLNIKDELADEIVQKAIGFLKVRSFQGELWRFADLSDEYIVPFDSDSTALASFVLESAAKSVNNKRILNSQINADNHYDLWIRPKQLGLKDIKIWFHNRKASKCIPLVSGAIQFGDFEFAVTCNNLLYAGRSEKNKQVWKNVHDCFANDRFDRQYYPSNLNAIYAYARACFYHDVETQMSGDSVNRYLEERFESATEPHSFLDSVLLANSLLFLNKLEDKYNALLDTCFTHLKTYAFNEINAFYCSNLQSDVQSDGKSPNTYFGSSAITVSLYLEFLNLYRFRFYGAYYSLSQ